MAKRNAVQIVVLYALANVSLWSAGRNVQRLANQLQGARTVMRMAPNREYVRIDVTYNGRPWRTYVIRPATVGKMIHAAEQQALQAQRALEEPVAEGSNRCSCGRFKSVQAEYCGACQAQIDAVLPTMPQEELFDAPPF